MPSIKYPDDLKSKSLKSLRRVSSSPDLHKSPTQPYGGGTYTKRSILRLRVREAEPSILSRYICAEIVHVFDITMAPAMIASIFEPAFGIEGRFVLKMFDRFYCDEVREQRTIQKWTARLDQKYFKYLLSEEGAHRMTRALRCGFQDYESDSEDEEEEDDGGEATKSKYNEIDQTEGHKKDEKEENMLDDEETKESDLLWDEIFVHAYCQKTFGQESGSYRKIQDIQGEDVPRLFACVELPMNYSSRYHSTYAVIHDIPGVLIQYVNGFKLSDIYDGDDLPAPRETWQYICDDAIKVVNATMRRGVNNWDTRVRNIMVQWDPTSEKYKAVMIDFGHCELRKDESDRDWREKKAYQDSEGAIGCVMERRLQERRGGGFVYRRTEYAEQLSYDFMGENGPRV
ncbi:hypothetical protein BS50DRAFT_570499 [Corynespora cassiicola Philippines]|uniref:Protein kinase domain-containing protein n=1 Tax=Corynespora cassiicola Philippines TaxID=1448308 RepID=A0A2T2P0D9_CORCC|nr:hypothetical protein BS50DRAFT_570499 [Corynespora cassiicola Philippines]